MRPASKPMPISTPLKALIDTTACAIRAVQLAIPLHVAAQSDGNPFDDAFDDAADRVAFRFHPVDQFDHFRFRFLVDDADRGFFGNADQFVDRQI